MSTAGKASTISLQGLAAYEALIQMAMVHKTCAALPALGARLEISAEDERVLSGSPPSNTGNASSRTGQGPRRRQVTMEHGPRREQGVGIASRMKRLLFANLALLGNSA